MRKFLLWLAGGVDKHGYTHNSVVRDLQRQVDVLAKDLTKRNEEIREVVSERDEFIDQRNELTVEVASLKDDKQELESRMKACIEQCQFAQKKCRHAELELHSFKEESRLMKENYETTWRQGVSLTLSRVLSTRLSSLLEASPLKFNKTRRVAGTNNQLKPEE